MSLPGPRTRDDRRLSLLTAVLVNAIPVVGVVFLEWSLASLVIVYWFELAIGLGFAAVRALFARQPPEQDAEVLLTGAFYRRGALPVPGTDLRIGLANLPIVALALPVFGVGWFVLGSVMLVGLEAALSAETITAAVTSSVVLALFGIAAGRAVETVRYCLAGEYASDSPQDALQSALTPLFVVGFVLIATSLVAAEGVPPLVVLVGVVGVKFGADLIEAYRDRFDDLLHSDVLEPDDEELPPAGWPTVDPVEPTETARPPWRALAVDGVGRGLRTPATGFAAFVAAGFLFLTVLAGDLGPLAVGAAIAGAILAAFAALGVVDRLVRHATMEYRIGADGDVVGCDRLFGTREWRVPAAKLAESEPQRTVADRLFDTRTVTVDHHGRTIRIAHLPAETATELTESAGERTSASVTEGSAVSGR